MTSPTARPVAALGAVVLAGGRSARLGGVPKSRLRAGRSTLLGTALTALLDAGVDGGRIVVVGPADALAGSGFESHPGLRTAQEDPPFSGPAAAIAAGVEVLAADTAPAVLVFTLACDMPGVAAGVTALLTAATRSLASTGDPTQHVHPPEDGDPVPDAWVGVSRGAGPDGGEKVQNLLALHRLPPLRAALAAQDTAGASVRRLLAGLRVHHIDLPTGSADDVDTWDDAVRLGVRHPTGTAPGWAAAMRIAAAAAPLMPLVDTPLDACAGAVLGRDVHSPIPIPHFDSSAMDGFAVSGPPPWDLDASAPSPAPLGTGRARRVHTGSPVPPGATGIIRDEYARITGDRLAPIPDCPHSELQAGRHIRRAGRESAAGEVLVPGGTVLGPAHVAYAAVAGLDALPVRRRPRVALIRTGDEVRSTGIPGLGEVRDAFGPQLPAFVRLLGGDVVSHVRIGDDAAATRDALAAATEADADLVLTTGGTGRSPADHVRRVVEDTAVDVVFGELDMRPGHPTMLARLPGPATWHLGLPGNPLAAMVAMCVVAEPFLRAATGLPPVTVREVRLAAGSPGAKVERLTPARRVAPTAAQAARSRTVIDIDDAPDGRTEVWELCDRTGSNMLRGLAQADGLIVLPRTAVAPGGTVPCLGLPWAAMR